MDRKEKVFSYISSKEYIPLKFKELVMVLDVPENGEDELGHILEELCVEGKIHITKRGRYIPLASDKTCVSGKLICNAKGFFGFVICDGEEDDVFVAGSDMGTALHSDRVLVRIDKEDNDHNHREGHVIKVLERGSNLVVGVFYKEKDGLLYLRPDNRQFYAKITVSDEKAMTAKVGDRAAVRVTEYTDTGKVFGEVVSVLGEEESLKSCIEGIIISNNIEQHFNSETIRESEKIPSEVSAKQIEGREDLRDMLIFTIDGDDARDFDDAISLSMNEDGNYILGVHIADVSEYVHEGSALDQTAYERATSVYLADRVIPMLPERLSNGICSLNPHVDRLTLSVFMEISHDGNIINHRLIKSVIRSKERMTYNNVNKILEENDTELCEKYSHLVPTLKCMENLARILRDKRDRRGAIQFDFPESHVVVNEDGEPISIEKEIRGVSNKMIEEFMLSANETIAEYAFWSEIPFVYRNHEAPSLEKIKAFNSFLLGFGISMKGKIDKDNPIRPKTLQKVLDDIKDTAEERIISMNMLQSLMKAKYSEENLGHFGLAAKYYCHFTSPIRRYPDLAIHRILKLFIDGKLTDEKISYLKGYVSKTGIQSSEKEVCAEYAERDVDDLMKTAYMSKFIGETFEGVVSNVMAFGMFVELENSVEGLVRVENMSDDYYEYDEKLNVLSGRRKKRLYRTGDSVKVVVAKTDIMLRQIDFVLEKDASEKVLKSFEEDKGKIKIEKKKHFYKSKKKYKRKKRRNG